MILPIYVNGNDILRTECKEVTRDYPNLDQLIKNMYESMAKADGVGLAAVQVGVPLRMFVADLTEFEDDELTNDDMLVKKRTFINPEIINRSEELCPYKEGCLSVPGITELVTRSNEVTLKYLNEDWETVTETFTGIWARVVQHEYDHLDGKLFVDHLAPIRKQLLKSKLQGMQRGNYKAKYKTKR